jgi:hypothetical protein
VLTQLLDKIDTFMCTNLPPLLLGPLKQVYEPKVENLGYHWHDLEDAMKASNIDSISKLKKAVKNPYALVDKMMM